MKIKIANTSHKRNILHTIVVFVIVALITPITAISAVLDNLDQVDKLIDEQQFNKAYQLLSPIAEAGNSEAQFQLGLFYQTISRQSVDKKTYARFRKFSWNCLAYNPDWNKLTNMQRNSFLIVPTYTAQCAININGLLEKAATSGHARAQEMLARRYEYGNGIRKDKAIAISLYEKAAKQGLPDSLTALATAYIDGVHKMQNYALAKELLEKSILIDGFTALPILGKMYENGWGVKKNITIADEFYTRVAIKGNYVSALALARMYSNGKNTTPNYPLALKWYEVARIFRSTIPKGRNEILSYLSKTEVEEAVKFAKKIDKNFLSNIKKRR